MGLLETEDKETIRNIKLLGQRLKSALGKCKREKVITPKDFDHFQSAVSELQSIFKNPLSREEEVCLAAYNLEKRAHERDIRNIITRDIQSLLDTHWEPIADNITHNIISKKIQKHWENFTIAERQDILSVSDAANLVCRCIDEVIAGN